MWCFTTFIFFSTINFHFQTILVDNAIRIFCKLNINYYPVSSNSIGANQMILVDLYHLPTS